MKEKTTVMDFQYFRKSNYALIKETFVVLGEEERRGKKVRKDESQRKNKSSRQSRERRGRDRNSDRLILHW
jgi:hypothetical protein